MVGMCAAERHTASREEKSHSTDSSASSWSRAGLRAVLCHGPWSQDLRLWIASCLGKEMVTVGGFISYLLNASSGDDSPPHRGFTFSTYCSCVNWITVVV